MMICLKTDVEAKIRAATVREWLRREPNVTPSNRSLTVAARFDVSLLRG